MSEREKRSESIVDFINVRGDHLDELEKEPNACDELDDDGLIEFFDYEDFEENYVESD